MSDFDDNDLNRDEERRVAVAEYVLGLTSAQSRAAMARAIESRPDLAAEVAYWEHRFSAFNEDYVPTTPSAGLLNKIEQRLFADVAAKTPWYNSLLLWRSLAGVAAAVAVLSVGLNLLLPTVETPLDTTQLVAAMQTVDSDVSFIARYDAGTGALRVSGTGSPAGAGNDYELWFIEGDNAPISMGVIDVAEAQTIAVDETLRGRLAQGITLAVTREVEGGSPTGDPQGPVVAAGPIAAI
ncbi:anti-sigma factor [Pelagibacterium flavum]|uniref:Anti-sigma factor n=1 Tax=Pelagibacterium flavum TaxID=2984530 RepID=A0ABY6IMJ0_9HYPH|nr:anti-sigma factor [Pelagibacterium sp. YIM 151497]UYQ71809.1 anti-sigma factor [Pelagibacterium sp. YIM 151497]